MTVGSRPLALVAAVIVIVAARDAPTPSGPVPQPRLAAGATIAGQVIAFASPRDAGFFQTFVMQANGTKVTQLTNQPFYNAMHAPTGRMTAPESRSRPAGPGITVAKSTR